MKDTTKCYLIGRSSRNERDKDAGNCFSAG
jgi:hypothetical protein